MISFLTESKLKIIYCINEATMIKDIRSEVEKMFYKSYHIYHENRVSQRETFIKSSRDILITQASFLLSYLRQGLINLNDVNYLIFEPKKLLFGEENCVEAILKEFYIPLMNLGSVNLPKIFIIDTSTDDNKINNGLRSSTLEDVGLRNTELILAICKHTYQIFCEKKEENGEVIEYKVMKDSRIFQTLSLMMQDIIISRNQKIFDTNCFSILHKHQSQFYEQILGYSFFYNPNYLELENVINMGNIVLDLFQLSLMDKKNLQSQIYISRIMYNVLLGITQSSYYATRLYTITEKIKTINENVLNININDILIIFADTKGNPNLFSKLLKILDLISIKEDVSGSGDSELTKKLFLPIHVQFMLIASLSIYLYGDIYLCIHQSGINSIQDHSHSFNDTISWAEDFIINFNNSGIMSYEEIDLIHEISNYWKDLYSELFKQCQQQSMSFVSEKATLLEYEVFNQLESDSQIIVLTERKIEALMIYRMLSKLTNSNIKLYVEHQSTETNYTGLGASYLSKNQMSQDVEKFKKKIAPKNANLDWNVEPYIALAKLVVNEQVMIDNNERANTDALTDFQQSKTRLLVSNCYKNTFFAQSKISVILFNEEKFKSVALSPPVLLNGVKISSVRNQKEETLRKIRKIEKNMKQIYEIKNKSEFRNAQKQGFILSECNQMFSYENKNNTIPRVQWYNAIDLFQSVVLCNLSNNYQNISFSLKFIGNKDNYQIYKVNIILDDNKKDNTIYCVDSCLISSIIPYILNMLKTMSCNKTPIIQGFSIIETPYCTNRRKAEPIISKAEEKKKDDIYWGQKTPTIDYEYLMDPVDSHFRKGVVAVYHEEYKSDCQQWGVICDTKLFHGRRIKTTLPTWKYFEDRKNNKKVEKDVLVLLTDHYKFFNIFMIYEIYKARNLFYYQFLCRSINSSMEIRNIEKIEQLKKDFPQLMKDSPQHNFKLIDEFSKFLDLIREFVNSDAVSKQIGTFLSEDSIEQEGSLPILVPIKMLDKSITIDEEVVNKFIESIMHSMKVYLELEKFEKGTYIYDSTKFYNLFTHDFYSGSFSTFTSIMGNASSNLYLSDPMSVNDSSFNAIILDTSTQTIKNLNESKNSGNGSDSIFKDDSKSIDSGDSKSSKSQMKKKDSKEKK